MAQTQSKIFAEGFVMDIPIQVVFEHYAPSERIEARVREEFDKLEQFYDRIVSARAVVARPQHRHHRGDVYAVRLHLAIAGGADIAVSREPAATGAHEDIGVTIRDAFKAARRQLQDLARKRQGHVKAHAPPPHGRITTLRPEQDHGFIGTADGREVYFHRNSVAETDFDALHIGQEVRFAESRGDKGPQATFVRPIGKHHIA